MLLSRPRHASLPQCGLYAITDGRRAGLLEAVRTALEGGATMLQYRDKTSDHERRLRETHALAALCGGFGVPLIVNDDVDLALASNAGGVHLGEDDADVAMARTTLGPDAIIGVSCYDSLQRAAEAAAAGADYLAFGTFFPTTSKTVIRYATPALLREAKAFGLPLVAIGGVTADNGAALIEAGADFLAAISGVFSATDIRTATRLFAALFDENFKDTGSPPSRK